MRKKFLSILILAMALLVTACGDDVAGPQPESGPSITVSLVNGSGVRLYFMVHRSDDGFWLKDIGTSPTWSGSFIASECVASVEIGATLTFAFPEYSGGSGCRMYVGESSFTGLPDLATCQFIYDKIECGWPPATWNTTCVDFFGIAMQMSSGDGAVGFNDGITRRFVMDSLETLTGSAPYTNASYQGLRFFSLDKVSPDDLDDCFGQAIALGLPLLEEVTLPGSLGTFNYGGFIYGDIQWDEQSMQLSASCEGYGTITLDSIDTEHVVGNTIPHTGDTDAAAKFAGLIGVAVHRGVLHNPNQWGDPIPPNDGYPDLYYHAVPDSNGGEFNEYAAILHSLSMDDLCYAQSYDDFFHQDPSMPVSSGGSVTITVLPFE